MVQKVIKYGNSLAVVLPADIAAQSGLAAGSLVSVEAQDGRVSVCPVEVVPKLSDQDRAFVDRLYREHRQVFDSLAE